MLEDKNGFIVSLQALDTLIKAHDGDSALLFLYLLRGGTPDRDSAALELCRTGAEISSAFEKLERMGILPTSIHASGGAAADESRKGTATPLPAKSMPEYTVEDISSRTASDNAWAAVKAAAEQITGHILTSNDIRILYGAYDYLELNGEVLILLLHFLGEIYEEKYAGRKKPGAKAIETEAFRWHDAGIDSYEAAEAYIVRRKDRAAKAGRIKEILQIHGRNLTPGETKYIESWIAIGMAEDAIGLAYDRTIVNKGQLIWPYMNKILQRWNDSNLRTAEEINRSGETNRPAGSNAKSGRTRSGSGIELQSEEELQRLIDSI